MSNLTSESPNQAAKRFAAEKIKEGYIPEALHEYTGLDGKVIYWRIRLKDPKSGKKWIRPMYVESGSYVLREPKFAKGKPLYKLKDLIERKDEIIILSEGEWCVDTMSNMGLLATTSGSVDSVDSADWEVLAGRTVVIWPDNDAHNQRFITNVIEKLKPYNCFIKVIDISKLGLPEKGDVIDWLELNPNAKAIDIQNLPTFEIGNNISDKKSEIISNESEGSQNQASIIVSFVESNTYLFHDLNKYVYAQDHLTYETRRIDSRQFRDWLVSCFYKKTGKIPRDQSVKEALSTLSGLGRYEYPCREVFLRIAKHDDDYFIDMAEPGKSRAIKTNSSGWEIVDRPVVHFVRPESMQPLVEPVKGGDIDFLWDLVNIPQDARKMVLTWLCDCLRLDTPFPILELIGEQGTAKSTTQAVLRKLFDPNSCNLRAVPKNIDDIYVSAGVSWLMSYENISYLSPQVQDSFCIISTGGGHAKRKLYSDADESVFTVKRPIVLNGISVCVTAQDLIDRTLTIELPNVEARQEVADLWHRFDQHHSSILGGLLDLFVLSLNLLPKMIIPLKERPRLLEYARLGMALAENIGSTRHEFMGQFNARRHEAIRRTIDSNPVATAVIEWLERNPQGRIDTAKSLMTLVEVFKPAGCEAWPRSAKGFADSLRRLAPALRQIGISCRSYPKTGGEIRWEIRQYENDVKPSPACPGDPTNTCEAMTS